MKILGGIIWVHNTFRKFRKSISYNLRYFFRHLCCRTCRFWRRSIRSKQQQQHELILGNGKLLPTPSTALATISESFASVGPATLLGNHLLSSIIDAPPDPTPPPPPLNFDKISQKQQEKMKKLTATQRYLAKKQQKKKFLSLPHPHQLDTISDAGTFEG